MRKFTSRSQTIIIGGFIALSASAAYGADMSLPMPPSLEGSVVEYASGWYLRGDVGYRMNRVDSANAVIAPSPTAGRVDDSYGLGGGVGYKWHWFRTDLTVDYGTRNVYRGDFVLGTDDYFVKLDNLAIMANAYLDLGSWSGITPYVGAGVGGALVDTMEFSRAASPTVSPTQVSSKWNFAWAAMAGIGYNLTENFLIDIGYRYINFGDATTEKDVFSNKLTLKDIAAHEFRVGMRYQFD